MIWAPSRHCFLVGKSGKVKRKSFHIPRKVAEHPRSMVKWLISTRRAIEKFMTTGEEKKPDLEAIDAIGTDEEV